MNKAKKGYTLIEVIIVLAIVLLLGWITVTVSYKTIENYFISLESCYRDDKFDNALLYIDTLCNSNGIISIEENKIFTEKLTKDIKSNNIVVTTKEINEDRSVKIIYLKDNNLKVRTLNYKGKNVTVGDNILLDKVNEFNVKRKKNLVYYYIKNNEYKLRGRCIWRKNRG